MFCLALIASIAVFELRAQSPAPDFNQDNATPRPARRGIVVGLPVLHEESSGNLNAQLNVRQASHPGHYHQGTQAISSSLPPSEALPPPAIAPEDIPSWSQPVPGNIHEPLVDPIFGDVVDSSSPGPHLGLFERWFGPSSYDFGVGHERVVFAPFEIDVSQPQNQYRFRIDSVKNFHSPDMAEYLWAAPGKGPAAERAVNYQDLRMLFETGTPSFSVGTEIPIRVLDPEIAGNTAGMGDMSVTTKTVLLNGSDWQLTQIFRSYFNTGAFRKGLGNGHVSLEPGMLARYKWNDSTYFHGELKYWFPLGGDPAYSGQILQYGLGWSQVLYDSDRFAVLSTMEGVLWSVLDGQRYDFTQMRAVDIDSANAVVIYPGLRFVRDSGGDLGVCELGISGGLEMGSSTWYDTLLRLEVKWVY